MKLPLYLENLNVKNTNFGNWKDVNNLKHLKILNNLSWSKKEIEFTRTWAHNVKQLYYLEKLRILNLENSVEDLSEIILPLYLENLNVRGTNFDNPKELGKLKRLKVF
eukprot:UN08410